ncbi:hypothetical protein PILCRDRAFT_90951 [Piloderma croceum F 1598]|uniref:Uncharacterized protein n=1 Tax=Piloderma croceum (strain F 1598) TaxID=765440 RepID=A0A0C3AV32_PILCF|nr:hypothetical protein PILCRDRAFT_90951 [Piloderma croceum F 1598]
MQLFLSLIGMLALYTTAVDATAWVVGYQSSRYPGWNVRQYNDIYVGNPLMVAYLFAGPSTPVGQICTGTWQEWYRPGNPNPGRFDFNCIPPVADVNSNASNNGMMEISYATRI